jgi:hypothetical protein
VGIDGISLFLVVSPGFDAACRCLPESVHDRVKGFSMCLLALESA